ncbi:hypothetical protein [Streptomyces sp. SBT349]|uniref:hypothetical protein n=1 Tax=Streptomyces sp. SBT349 TaxID=1580539 RepID=UPI00099CBD2B|nr:hypothetical protein [Streptomyces sp. SBT349]
MRDEGEEGPSEPEGRTAPPDREGRGGGGTHRVVLTERGPFVAPRCSCGWYGPARRSRPLARDEAAAHTAAAGPG